MKNQENRTFLITIIAVAIVLIPLILNHTDISRGQAQTLISFGGIITIAYIFLLGQKHTKASRCKLDCYDFTNQTQDVKKISRFGISKITPYVFNVSAIFFMWAFVAYLIFYVFVFLSGNSQSTLNGAVSNETLLALLSIVAVFASLLSFIFKHLVQQAITQEVHKLAREERIASKIEMQVVASHIFTILYEVTDELSISNEVNTDLYNILLKKNFLERAIHADEFSAELINILEDSTHLDVILKAKNNRAWNILLKERLLQKTNKHVSPLERAVALQIKDDIWSFLCQEKTGKAYDIKKYHIDAWLGTCTQIEDTFIKNVPKIDSGRITNIH